MMRLLILGLAVSCAVDALQPSSWMSSVTQCASTPKPFLTATRSHTAIPQPYMQRRWISLQAAAEGEEAAVEDEVVADPEEPKKKKKGGGSKEEEAADSEAGAAAGAGEEEEVAAEAAAEAEEEEEDPEVVALKVELTMLEADVKAARFAVGAAKDQLGDGGQGGYQRIAAKVQDFKMRSKDGAKGDKNRAMVKVATSFLPIMDELAAGVDLLPAEDEGAKNVHNSFQTLAREMEGTFAKFGLEAFHSVLGESFDSALHEKAEGPVADALLLEAAPGASPNTVAAQVRAGQRLQGAVIRRALVVVVAAPAAAPAAASEEEEAPAEPEAPVE